MVKKTAASKSAKKSAKTPKKSSAKKVSAVPMASPVNIKDEKLDGVPKAPPVHAASLFEQHPPVPNAFKITARAWKMLQDHWQVFLGIILIYAGMNIVFVQGLHAQANLSTIKTTLDTVPTAGFGHVVDGLSLVTTLMGAAGSSVAPTAGPYQFILSVVVSLAVIWCFREIFAKRKISLRDSFYQGMYPFVTFLLVGLLIVLQLLPFAIGSALYSIIVANGIATGLLMQGIFIVLFLVLAAVSLYMLCSTLFALYIVTLTGMTPWAAARTARDLVAHRRFSIMRKVLFMPLLLLLVTVVVLLPFVMFLPVLAPWVFTVLAAVLLVYGNSYMYTLYRALI